MNSGPNFPAGKIIKHGDGLGLTDERDVEQRAAEIARIEGHRAVRDDDRRQAELELNGGSIPPGSTEDEVGEGSLSRDPSEPASNPGRRTPDREASDEEFAVERLVAEGVTEAEYDQMLAARRRKRE